MKLNPQFLEAAQQAALMQVANGTLSHQPPPSWRCFTPAGEAGSRFSNLAVGPILELNGPDPGRVLARQVDIYFAEPGRENFVDVGHRRWNLYPQYAQGAYGIVFDPRAGRVTQANANWIFGFDESVPDPEFIAFPEKDGYLYRLEGFSGQPLSAYRWSFSVPSRGGKADLSQALVRITDALTGEPVPVGDLRVGDPAFGLETLTTPWVRSSPIATTPLKLAAFASTVAPPAATATPPLSTTAIPKLPNGPHPSPKGWGSRPVCSGRWSLSTLSTLSTSFSSPPAPFPKGREESAAPGSLTLCIKRNSRMTKLHNLLQSVTANTKVNGSSSLG